MEYKKFKDINWDEWEECTYKEAEASIRMKGIKVIYLRKAQKFPICFEIDLDHEINVEADGEMKFIHNNTIVFTIFPEEIPKFVKAVEKAKEVLKLKK